MKTLITILLVLSSTIASANSWYTWDPSSGCKTIAPSIDQFMISVKECGLYEHDEKNGFAMFLCNFNNKGTTFLILTNKTSKCHYIPDMLKALSSKLDAIKK